MPEDLKLPNITVDGVTGPVYDPPPAVVHHKGREFTSGGGFVSPTHLFMYLGRDKRGVHGLCVTDWHGNVISLDVVVIGKQRVRSWRTDCWLYIRVVINGVTYSGISGGVGMYIRARRIKGD